MAKSAGLTPKAPSIACSSNLAVIGRCDSEGGTVTGLAISNHGRALAATGNEGRDGTSACCSGEAANTRHQRFDFARGVRNRVADAESRRCLASTLAGGRLNGRMGALVARRAGASHDGHHESDKHAARRPLEAHSRSVGRELRREWNGSRPNERLPETGDHHEVGVLPHSRNAASAKRRQSVLVLEPPKLPLDSSAAAVEPLPLVRPVRDCRERDRASLAERNDGDDAALAPRP